MYQVIKNLKDIKYETKITKNKIVKYINLKNKEKKC